MNRTGRVSGKRWAVVITAILLFFLLTLTSCGGRTPTPPTPTPTTLPPDDGNIQVYVYDAVTQSSLNGVVVRVTNSSLVDGIDHRKLVLPSCEQGRFLVVSAPGYETSFTPCNGSDSYYFGLNKINGEDNVNYLWLSAYSECGRCHARQLGDGYNEVEEWEQTGHARVFADPYFQSLYRGTNVNGQPTTPTENHGPGFKLDKPQEAGNCAYCHAPTTILASQGDTDLTTYYPRPAGVGGEGVTCDVCHKVSGVKLDGDYPNEDNPGVLSLEFQRLSNSFILGPFSNILLPMGDESQRHAVSSCAPILSQSEFCAACHYGKFNDMIIYNSYGEWKESVYGRNPRNAAHKTCQDCHMSHMDVKNVTTPLSLRSACFETTEEYQDFDHNLMDVGPDDAGNVVPRMIQNAASLKVELKHDANNENSLQVHVEVENTKAGHKFPTDSPLRHLILVVSATDHFGSLLEQEDGEKIPDWAGTDNAFMNSNGVRGYAGQPGRIFANLLVDETTNLSPAATYWNNTNYVTVEEGKTSDTRLAPRDKQESSYSFAMPDLGEIHITVKLIYRYAFFDLMNQKGWTRPDIVVASVECSMFQEPTHEMECTEVQP